MTDRLLTAAEVAELLNVPTRFVREHTRNDAIPHLRIGQRYVRYRRQSVLAWLDTLETTGTPIRPRKHHPATSNET